jgi:hypothetical protein
MIKRANQASLELKEQLGPEAEELIARIRERARNLYLNHQLLCAEAVMVALNNGLDGGLSDAQAVAMAAPFCVLRWEKAGAFAAL